MSTTSHQAGIYAVADAWASIDGKMEAFRAGAVNGDPAGHHEGYLADARAMIERVQARGFAFIPVIPRDVERRFVVVEFSESGAEASNYDTLERLVEDEFAGLWPTVAQALINAPPGTFIEFDPNRTCFVALG